MNPPCAHGASIQNLTFYFDSPDGVAEIWAAALGFLRERGLLRNCYHMTFPGRATKERRDEPLLVSGEEALEILRARRPQAFGLRYEEGNLSQLFSLLPGTGALRFNSFTVGSQIPEVMPSSWAPLIETLARSVRLAIAGSGDSEYLGWQTCAEPQYYASKYGPIDGFRILRPLPPPLDTIEKLDTSTNPGRFDHYGAGPAFVSAELWMGPAFWDYAPCRKEEVLAQPWLKTREGEHFLHVVAYHEPFTRPDGEQGAIQKRLWQLLFHSDCRWHPGNVA